MLHAIIGTFPGKEAVALDGRLYDLAQTIKLKFIFIERVIE
jgi:hypothetical protein